MSTATAAPGCWKRRSLAYKTGNYDRAVDLADKYIGENNRDWNGFYVKAQGLSGQDRFDEARKALEQAGRLNAQDASIPTLAAQTYVAEARKVTQAGSEARLLSPKASAGRGGGAEETQRGAANAAGGLRAGPLVAGTAGGT